MIDFNKLNINDYILYTEPNNYIWLGKVINIFNSESVATLQLIYSDAIKAIKKYPFYKDQCSNNNWSIPSEKQLKFYFKLMIFE